MYLLPNLTDLKEAVIARAHVQVVDQKYILTGVKDARMKEIRG